MFSLPEGRLQVDGSLTVRCVKSPLSAAARSQTRLDAKLLTRDTCFSFRHPTAWRTRPSKPLRLMTQEEERELRAHLARLLQEHRDLDSAIEALQGSAASDLLQVQRLKKRKLQLKDRITFVEDQLTPDIIA
jgi:hypothetical protein